MVVGLVVEVLNLAMETGNTANLLPGDHSPLYLFAAPGFAGWGTWWLGWDDRPIKSGDDRRPFLLRGRRRPP